MATSNPYAPPQQDDFSGLPLGTGGGMRLHGDTLICDKGLALPRLCLFNGEPSAERVSRTLSWAPQWFLAVAVISPLIGAIIYFIVRKTGQLEYSLSATARKRARGALWLAVGGIVGGVLLAIVAGANDLPILALVAIVAALVAIVVGSARSRLFTVAQIDKQQIHLKLRPDAARAFERHLAGQA